MAIRRLHYQIDYYHILTFNQQYKDVVNPYFPFGKVEYAIDNENTVHEQFRLIFRLENIAIILNKQSLIFLFEGDVKELRNQNGPIKMFWDIYEKIKGFKNYTRSTKHTIIAHAVVIKDEKELNNILEQNPYFTKNPFGKVEEFACNYEFIKNDLMVKFLFGNYNEKDIQKHDLLPFNTEFNKDLIKNVGIMARIEVSENDKTPNYNKFKTLLLKTEEFLSEYDLLNDE